MTKCEQLINEIEAFCQAKGLSEREFSLLAIGSPKFVMRLRRNAVTSRNMTRADEFLIEHAASEPFALKVQMEARRAADRSADLVAA